MRCLLPTSGQCGVGDGRSGSDRSASGRASSPQPGPSGLGSVERSAPCTDRSRSGFAGRSSSAPSGAAEDDRDSISSSVDLDRDDLFRSVLHLIREFHSMEEPASVASNRCKTSLAPIYGLQSESSPALHLPFSPLLWSLLEDMNLALSKFVEDQTVLRFLPVPGRRHRRYYRTSSSSFPAPCTVLPGLASYHPGQGESHGNIPFPCPTRRSPLWRPCCPAYARSPPGWIGGFPLAGVSGSIYPTKSVATSNI